MKKKIALILCFVICTMTLMAQKKVSSTCSLVKKEDMDYCINNSVQQAPSEAQQLLAKLKAAQKYTGSINRYISCNKVTSFVPVIDNEGNNCLLYPNAAIFKKLSDPNTQEFIDFCHAIAHFKLDGNKTEHEFRQEGFDLETVLSKMPTAPPPSPVSNSSTPSLLGIWEGTVSKESVILEIEKSGRIKIDVNNSWIMYETWEKEQNFLIVTWQNEIITLKIVWENKNICKAIPIGAKSGIKDTVKVIWKDLDNCSILNIEEKPIELHRTTKPFPRNLEGIWKSNRIINEKNCQKLLWIENSTILTSSKEFKEIDCEGKIKNSGEYSLEENVLILTKDIYSISWSDHDNFILTTINNGKPKDKGKQISFSRTNLKKI